MTQQSIRHCVQSAMFFKLRPLDAYILCQTNNDVNTLYTYCNSVQEYQCIEDILQLFIYLFPVESLEFVEPQFLWNYWVPTPYTQDYIAKELINIAFILSTYK